MEQEVMESHDYPRPEKTRYIEENIIIKLSFMMVIFGFICLYSHLIIIYAKEMLDKIHRKKANVAPEEKEMKPHNQGIQQADKGAGEPTGFYYRSAQS